MWISLFSERVVGWWAVWCEEKQTVSHINFLCGTKLENLASDSSPFNSFGAKFQTILFVVCFVLF